MESNFQKYTLKTFQTGGRAPGAPALDPPLIIKCIVSKRKLRQLAS